MAKGNYVKMIYMVTGATKGTGIVIEGSIEKDKAWKMLEHGQTFHKLIMIYNYQ